MNIELKREDFINQYPPSNLLNKRDVSSLWKQKDFNLYVHIPFCSKKCEFCYYKSDELGDDPVPDEYVNALLKEMEMLSKLPQIQSKAANSIYFGGGTPTKLTVEQMKRLLDSLHKMFNINDDYELCFEARPDKNTTEEKLGFLKEYGIKRLSFGVQSLDDEVLIANGRNHDVKSFYDAFERARKVGIPYINTDLISGLINQSCESWLDTIDQIINLHPENIAIYKLEIYYNNKLYRKIRENKITLSSNDEEIENARIGFKRLIDVGYIPVSNINFTSDLKYTPIHRKRIQDGEDMLGLGASAHSCVDGFIFQNNIDIKSYIKMIEASDLPVMRAYKMSKREEMIQRIVLGLKNYHFNREIFRNEFGIDALEVYPDEFKFLEEKEFITINENTVSLTLEGMLFADDIVRIFFLDSQKGMYLSHYKRA